MKHVIDGPLPHRDSSQRHDIFMSPAECWQRNVTCQWSPYMNWRPTVLYMLLIDGGATNALNSPFLVCIPREMLPTTRRDIVIL